MALFSESEFKILAVILHLSSNRSQRTRDLTHEDFCRLSGMSTRTVRRALSSLHANGYINRKRLYNACRYSLNGKYPVPF